ncbi:MAG: 4-hydroxythreonine-4-phosphate dehydrogenase PdxA [Gemmatimonadota bacterium]
MRLAVTLGDPRGIGPEVAAKAAERFRIEEPSVELTLLGATRAAPDEDDRSAGTVAAEAIERAVALALDGSVHGIVTAPIMKPALHAAGRHFPGHTEMLQELSGVPETGMLMVAERTIAGPPLRVLLATTHLPLRDVPSHVTSERLVSQSRLLLSALRRDFGIASPRIALCALNPHASDGGLFGDEEARVYGPALRTLQTDPTTPGTVDGPIPADTVFRRCLNGEFDAVVAPYHDVGMAAFKTVSFGAGVNVTLGLPFARTSPDHGTAFDLAGKGVADASSMLEALRLAARIHRSRFDSLPARA